MYIVFVFFNIHRKVIITIECPVTLPTIYFFYDTGEFIPSFLATQVVSTFHVYCGIQAITPPPCGVLIFFLIK